MSCECKKKFDLENAVALKYGMQLENFKSEAKKRLGEICKETCFVCLNTIKNSNINNPSNIQHKNGNFLLDINQKPEKENVIEYNICYDYHLICKYCVENFKNDNRKNLEKAKNSISFPIKCNICGISHEFKIENIKKIFKATANCCLIF